MFALSGAPSTPYHLDNYMSVIIIWEVLSTNVCLF